MGFVNNFFRLFGHDFDSFDNGIDSVSDVSQTSYHIDYKNNDKKTFDGTVNSIFTLTLKGVFSNHFETRRDLWNANKGLSGEPSAKKQGLLLSPVVEIEDKDSALALQPIFEHRRLPGWFFKGSRCHDHFAEKFGNVKNAQRVIYKDRIRKFCKKNRFTDFVVSEAKLFTYDFKNQKYTVVIVKKLDLLSVEEGMHYFNHLTEDDARGLARKIATLISALGIHDIVSNHLVNIRVTREYKIAFVDTEPRHELCSLHDKSVFNTSLMHVIAFISYPTIALIERAMCLWMAQQFFNNAMHQRQQTEESKKIEIPLNDQFARVMKESMVTELKWTLVKRATAAVAPILIIMKPASIISLAACTALIQTVWQNKHALLANTYSGAQWCLSLTKRMFCCSK